MPWDPDAGPGRLIDADAPTLGLARMKPLRQSGFSR